jgi:pyruvate,water dikinase
VDFFASAPRLLDLADPRAADASLTGAKAANLARARAAGLPVLGGFVLTTRGHPSPLELQAAWQNLSGNGSRPVVVRSSSVAEDGEHSAMAGRFRSVLGVRDLPALRRAVDEVLASAGDVDGGAAMAVLVQPELDCTCGGVMFGLDPSTGDARRLVVEVVPGGPDGLVSGRVTATRLVLSRRGRTVRVDGEPGQLTRRQRRWLARLAHDTEACFGGPQDVEWAVDHDGRSWLLQSRPITAVATPATGPVLGPGPVAETFPEPLGTLEADLWIDPLRRGIDTAIALTGTRTPRQRQASPVVTLVGGRVAADLELLGVHRPPAGFLRSLDPRGPARRLRFAWRVGRLRATLPATGAQLVADVDRRLAAVPRLDTLADTALLTVLRAVRDDLAVVHTAEVLAGMLLPPPVLSAAALASAAVAELRRAAADDEIIHRRPVVLALVPARVGAPHPLPSTVGAGSPGTVADLDPREALRLRARWLQELSARAADELGHRLVASGRIERAGRVNAYSLDDLAVLVAGGSPGAGLLVLPGPPLPAAFRLSTSGAVVAVAGSATEGRGASPGRVTGTVHHGFGADDLPPPGAVLVVSTLDPRLAGVLPRLGGLVSETGSTLSHLAILAREAGIPTVVAVPDALRRFPAGAEVLLDGTTGEVALVDPEPVVPTLEGAR